MKKPTKKMLKEAIATYMNSYHCECAHPGGYIGLMHNIDGYFVLAIDLGKPGEIMTVQIWEKTADDTMKLVENHQCKRGNR